MGKPVIVVKFPEKWELPYRDDVGDILEKLKPDTWSRLVDRFAGLKLDTLFGESNAEAIKELLKRAREMSPGAVIPEILTYFRITHPALQESQKLESQKQEISPEDIVKMARQVLELETAYVEIPAPDPAPPPQDDPYTPHQSYLGPAPEGINARYAWQYPGGCGEGQRLLDVERGWHLNHEDLADQSISVLRGQIVDSSRPHGTAVLGIVCARANRLGVVGVAPRLGRVDVVSRLKGGDDSLAPAIADAASQLSFGDILLLEAQSYAYGGTTVAGPPEILSANFDAIHAATLAGITVIEAAGNGDYVNRYVDLDTYVNGGPFTRDSGAVLVTAASAAAPHSSRPWTTRGQRVDCHCWGESVVTATVDQHTWASGYSMGFGGTSGAAAIVAGAAAVVQGVAEAHRKRRLSPKELRDLLRNPHWNTLPDSADAGRIGVQPDLCGIITKGLGLPPLVQPPDEDSTQPPDVPAAPSDLPGSLCVEEDEETGFLWFLAGISLGFLAGLLLGLFLGLFLMGVG